MTLSHTGTGIMPLYDIVKALGVHVHVSKQSHTPSVDLALREPHARTTVM